MKKSSGLVLLVALVSLAVLAIASVYFGAPLFGWLIIAFIFLIFIYAVLRDYRLLRSLESESDCLKNCIENGESHIPSSGFVAERFLAVKSLGDSLQSLSAQVSLELLNSRLAIRCGRNAGGVVILLGLMGTFFGLMLSVSTAGSTIDNSSSVATMNSIQSIFSNMKGIFGTSLCGIFASLILTFIHSLVERQTEVFVSDLDLWTISKLFPKYVSKKAESSVEANAWDKVSAALEESNKKMTDSLTKTVALLEQSFSSVLENQSGKMQAILNSVSEKVASSEENAVSMVKNLVAEMQTGLSESIASSMKRVDGLESSVGQNLQQAILSLTENVSAALLKQTASASEEWNAMLKHFADMADSGMTLQESRLQNLQKSTSEISDSMNSMMNRVAEIVDSNLKARLEASSLQWNEFMEKLAKQASESGAFQQESIKTLSEVAVQVAEKAQAGSVELSSKVTEEIQKLSQEVQQSFASLSSASSALVESQGRLISEIENRVVRENEASSDLAEGISNAASLMRVNQSEFAAGLEMFNKGLEALFEKLSGETEEKEQGDFLDQIRSSLELFHERASEILVENAVKTQEILLEILEQTQRTAHLSEKKSED